MEVVENAICRQSSTSQGSGWWVRYHWKMSLEDVESAMQVVMQRGTKYDIDITAMTQTNPVSAGTQNICIHFSFRVRSDLSVTLVYELVQQHLLEVYLFPRECF